MVWSVYVKDNNMGKYFNQELDHKLAELMREDRRRLFLSRVIKSAEDNGIDLADVSDVPLEQLSPEELNLLWRSMPQ